VSVEAASRRLLRDAPIRTNHGDREILLVEDGIAYYRVSDRIYSAPIGDAEIGQPTLVAKDELIRDVHSAFFKR